MVDKKLTGRIAADRIRMQSTPKPPSGAVERFLALGDCSGIISDVMDELGIPAGVVGASTLKPTMPGQVICGPALTVRNIAQRVDALAGAKASLNKMAEFEAHNLAEDGDVLVIAGRPRHVQHGRHLGAHRQARRRARRHRDGRHPRHPHSRSIGYPIWASEITPITGKWRLETVEINGTVMIGDVRVAPGDLVVADDTGVCFIPGDKIMPVLELCEKKARAEEIRCQAIENGIPVPEISRSTYGEKNK